MFSSREILRKKSKQNCIDRKEFIISLVEEFHNTTNIEAQEQISANLANFAYDPLNFQFLCDASALHLFFKLISLPNERLVLHGVSGICNICLYSLSHEEITKPENIKIIFETLQTTTNTETTIKLLTIFYLLAGEDNLRPKICTSENLQKIQLFTKSANERIKLLAIVFLEDFATRDKEINV